MEEVPFWLGRPPIIQVVPLKVGFNPIRAAVVDVV